MLSSCSSYRTSSAYRGLIRKDRRARRSSRLRFGPIADRRRIEQDAFKRPRVSATGYGTSAVTVNGGIDIGLIIGET